MRRKNAKNRIQAATVALLILGMGAGCIAHDGTEGGVRETELQEAYERAADDPVTPYPETVTYTLAKMTACGGSYIPEGDTYEDNAYTRFSVSYTHLTLPTIYSV